MQIIGILWIWEFVPIMEIFFIGQQEIWSYYKTEKLKLLTMENLAVSLVGGI